MNLLDLVELGEKVEKTNNSYINLEMLCEEFNLYYCDFEFDYDNIPFHEYWIAPWYCTDTWVGYSALYLHDTFLAIMIQYARKSDKNILWKGINEYNLAKEELLKWHIPEKINTLTDMTIDQLQKDGYKISYATGLLSETVIYKGKTCKVISIPRLYDTSNELKINFNGDAISVDISECIIPYKICS